MGDNVLENGPLALSLTGSESDESDEKSKLSLSTTIKSEFRRNEGNY